MTADGPRLPAAAISVGEMQMTKGMPTGKPSIEAGWTVAYLPWII